MGSLLGNIFSGASDKSADDTLAFNSMAAAAASAVAYLAATLDATTPEVRRLFAEYTTQSVMANEAVTALAVSKGWINPYNTIQSQLETTVNQSNSLINEA